MSVGLEVEVEVGPIAMRAHWEQAHRLGCRSAVALNSAEPSVRASCASYRASVPSIDRTTGSDASRRSALVIRSTYVWPRPSGWCRQRGQKRTRATVLTLEVGEWQRHGFRRQTLCLITAGRDRRDEAEGDDDAYGDVA